MQPLTPDALKQICLIATDMDGTLTQQEKFTPLLLQTLTNLAAAEIPVLIVTGRSAGWVSGLVHYLPVAGAIAENGGLFYLANGTEGELLTSISDVMLHRQKLAQMFEHLQAEFPHIQESTDNRFRITDWTFDVHGLSVDELQQMSKQCHAEGWGFTYSTVQCHVKPLQQDKAVGLQTVLSRYYPQLSLEQIVTVGDSPNDESLFDHSRLPLSVGVANIGHYANQMTHLPVYVTQAAEAEGFCELAQLIWQRQKAEGRSCNDANRIHNK